MAPRPLVTLELLGPGLTRLVVLAGEVETVRRGGFLGALLDTAGTLCKWQHGGCFSYVHTKLLLSISNKESRTIYYLTYVLHIFVLVVRSKVAKL